jgi:hypothetical protein
MGIKMKKLIVLFSVFTALIFSQEYNECGMIPNYIESFPIGYQVNPPQIGGRYAPAQTPNGAYVRIFCVFAQFAGDTKDTNDVNWPINQMPTWANTFIGTNINQAPYPLNTISNYFHQMSNGTNHIIGYVYPTLVTVNAPSTQYYGTSNLAVLQQIDPYVNFHDFDQWNMLSSFRQTFNQPDNYVDAVYIIWRNIDYRDWGGIADLGSNYTTNEGVIIDRRIPTLSMTLDIGGKSDYTFESKIGLLAHEYGHYLFDGGHNFENFYYGNQYAGYVQRGLALMNAGGGGGFAMNPQEKYILGYTTYTDIFSDQTGTLPDYNTTGTVYRIPIPLYINGSPNMDPTEFFAVANHQKISPYERGQNTGIWVYHIKNKNYSENHMDMLVANGNWDWQIANWVTRPSGYGSPPHWYWIHGNNPPALFPAIDRLATDRINGRDELQEVIYAQYPNGNYYWWDRWLDENGTPYSGVMPEGSKPWSMGYNQVFSPWSNPASYDKNRQPTNTGFEILSFNNGVYSLQFNTSASSNLAGSPSKPPLGAFHAGDGPIRYGWAYLAWGADYWDEQPIESDINWSELQRKISTNGAWQSVYSGPNRYWSDNSIIYDPENGNIPVFFRVRVRDSQNKWSIWSDLYDTRTFSNQNSTEKIKSKTIINIPTEYNLSSNYPNPFNPSTIINYAIKDAGLVSIKVYDVLGAEIATLVNETKEAGEYDVEFNASELPSGVYIYTLQTGDFISSKKMILMK